MVIATSITESYLQKSDPFFKSVAENFDGQRICFTIGFTAEIEGWKCITTEFPECKWQPENRPGYASLQHGEFIQYMPDDTEHDEMILFIDSDMVLQRKWDLNFPSMKGVMVTQCSKPMQPLKDVVKNLGGKNKLNRKYGIKKEYKEFCTGFIIATYASWEDIYSKSKELYPVLNNFKHHAAWQLLINLVVLNNFRTFLLPAHVCNASWYEGTQATGEPLQVAIEREVPGSDLKAVVVETVYFNHTKFN